MRDSELANIYRLSDDALRALGAASYPVPINKAFVSKWLAANSALQALRDAADCELRGMYYE